MNRTESHAGFFFYLIKSIRIARIKKRRDSAFNTFNGLQPDRVNKEVIPRNDVSFVTKYKNYTIMSTIKTSFS